MGDKGPPDVPSDFDAIDSIEEFRIGRVSGLVGDAQDLSDCLNELNSRTLDPAGSHEQWAQIFTKMLKEDTDFGDDPAGAQTRSLFKAFERAVDGEFN